MNCASCSAEELIWLCVDMGDATAWEEFVRRFHTVIAATVIKTARRFEEISPALADDLIQETFLRICAGRCRVLREFRPEGPEAIFGLLKTIAFSVTQDHFRGEWAEKRGGGRPEQSLDDDVQGGMASVDGLPSLEREILLKEIDRYLAAAADLETSRRNRRIFWLHYRQGMTAREVASTPGIGLTQKGVESTIQRLTAQVCGWLVEERLKKERLAEEAKGKQPGSSF